MVQALKVIILPLPLSAGVMCCPPLTFNPSLRRREKLPQKVGGREKLAKKVGRREIYRPVPPLSKWSSRFRFPAGHFLRAAVKSFTQQIIKDVL